MTKLVILFLSDFLFSLYLIHFFTDNCMDAATKSRTSEDILRSSRLSTYSPEPYNQSESDYYPYTSSPKGRNFSQFRIACCIVNCIFSVQFQLSVVIFILSAILLLCFTQLYINTRKLLLCFSQPIACREDAFRQEEMKRVGVTVFKE